MESIIFKTISSILNSWASYRIAIENSCAGSLTQEKKEWFPSAIEHWLSENDEVLSSELAEIIEDILFEEFNVQIDDNSVIEVCTKIIDSQNLCKQNKFDKAIEKYCQPYLNGLPTVTKQNFEDDSSDESSENEEMDIRDSPCYQSNSSEQLQTKSIDSSSEKTSENLDDEWTTVTRIKKNK